MIASAPMFLTKADRTATTTTSTASWARTEESSGAIALEGEFHDAAARHAGADQKRAADDDDDVVAETGEGFFQRNDADGERGKQRQRSDEIVAQPPPDEGRHHQRDDGEGEQLGQCEHGNSRLALTNALRRNMFPKQELVAQPSRRRGKSAASAMPEPADDHQDAAGRRGHREQPRRRRSRASPDRRQKAPGRRSRRRAAQRMTALKTMRPIDQQRRRVHDEESGGGRRVGRSAMRRDRGERDARRAADAACEDQEAAGHGPTRSRGGCKNRNRRVGHECSFTLSPAELTSNGRRRQPVR